MRYDQEEHLQSCHTQASQYCRPVMHMAQIGNAYVQSSQQAMPKPSSPPNQNAPPAFTEEEETGDDVVHHIPQADLEAAAAISGSEASSIASDQLSDETREFIHRVLDFDYITGRPKVKSPHEYSKQYLMV